MANFYLNHKTDSWSVISFNVNFDGNNHNAKHLLLAFCTTKPQKLYKLQTILIVIKLSRTVHNKN